MSVLPFDLGGGLVEADGALRRFVAPRPVGDGAAGGRYYPLAWRAALIEVAAALASADAPTLAAVEAVAICGFTRSQVFHHADGAPVHPAIGWADVAGGFLTSRISTRSIRWRGWSCSKRLSRPPSRVSLVWSSPRTIWFAC